MKHAWWQVSGADSAQGAQGPQTMLQAMTRIARWLARGSDSEGAVERAIRRSFVGIDKISFLFGSLMQGDYFSIS